MKKKKWLAMLLAVAMAITIIPTTAFANETIYLVYLNGAWLQAGETKIGDGKVTLDAKNNTLTIENVALTDFVSFEAEEEFTLIVKGTNTIKPSNKKIGIGTKKELPVLNIVLEEGALLDITVNTSNAINIRGGDLKVSGSGSLKLTSNGGVATLFAPGNVTFDGVTVGITGDQCGIYCKGVYNANNDEFDPRSVTMCNAKVDVNVSKGDYHAIYCAYGSIVIEEDTVLTTTTSTTEKSEEDEFEPENYGLYANDNILITGGKTDVKHTGGIGFDANTITIEGGKVDVKSNETALLGFKGVTINGGIINVESKNNYAILGTRGTVSITGADTEVTAITGSENLAAIGNAYNPATSASGDGGIHLDAKINVQGKNLIVGVKKDAEAAITLGENFEIAGATLKHESVDNSKTKTYFVDEKGNALTGKAVVCKHTYGETPTWTWAEDGSSATASFPCTASDDYTEVVKATLTSQTTPATCIAAGKTVYTAKATFSGKEYTNTKEIAIPVDADAHGETELKNAKDATCTEKGYTGDKVCKVCGEVVEAGKPVEKLAHSYKDGKCTVCGVADPDYVPATPDKPDSDSPQTGDNSSMVLWIALLFVSGTGLFGITAYSRKKRAR